MTDLMERLLPTPQEMKALCLVAQGLSNTEIAINLMISPRTVVSYLGNVYCKAGIDGSNRYAKRIKLVIWAIKNGYCSIDNES